MKQVVYTMLPGRTVPSEGFNAFAEIVAYLSGQPTLNTHYNLLTVGSQGVDDARNYAAAKFMQSAADDDDTLVMLDQDHLHPVDIVEQLVRHGKPVVSALAFKRKAPFFPVAYVRDPKDHVLKIPVTWPEALCKVQRTGAAAVAIQKRALVKLVQRGYAWPWFRFTYMDWGLYRGGEDIYFMESCEKAGVPVFCDFALVTPHLDTLGRAEADWRAWLQGDRLFNGEPIPLIDAVPERYVQEPHRAE